VSDKDGEPRTKVGRQGTTGGLGGWLINKVAVGTSNLANPCLRLGQSKASSIKLLTRCNHLLDSIEELLGTNWSNWVKYAGFHIQWYKVERAKEAEIDSHPGLVFEDGELLRLWSRRVPSCNAQEFRRRS